MPREMKSSRPAASAPPTRPIWPTGRLRSPGQGNPARARPRRCPRQQRRPLDPSLDRAVLRPLPRFRAHHAAQLLRLPPPDHGPAAEDDRAPPRAHHQHQLDRRAGELTAVLGLRRQQGRAGCLQPLRAGRVFRQEHRLHHDQHAAGEDRDDRADQDVRVGAHALAGRGRRPDRARRSSSARAASPRAWASSPRPSMRWRRRCTRW